MRGGFWDGDRGVIYCWKENRFLEELTDRNESIEHAKPMSIRCCVVRKAGSMCKEAGSRMGDRPLGRVRKDHQAVINDPHICRQYGNKAVRLVNQELGGRDGVRGPWRGELESLHLYCRLVCLPYGVSSSW